MNHLAEYRDPCGFDSSGDTPDSQNVEVPTQSDIKEEITVINFRRKPIQQTSTKIPHYSVCGSNKLPDSITGSEIIVGTHETLQREPPVVYGPTKSNQEGAKVESIVGIRIGVETHEYLVKWLGTKLANDWIEFSDCSNCLELIYDFHARMEDELGVQFEHITDVPKVCPPNHRDWLQIWQVYEGGPSSHGFLQLERVGLISKFSNDESTKEASVPLARRSPSRLIMKPTLLKGVQCSCKICAMLKGYKPRIPRMDLDLGGAPLSDASIGSKVDA